MTPLHLACQNGHTGVAELLIAKDINGETALHRAYQEGDDCKEVVVKLLIDNGVNLKAKDDGGKIPLYEACADGHLEVIKLLLSQGATVNLETAQRSTPLKIASEQNHLEVVWFLLHRYSWLVTEPWK